MDDEVGVRDRIVLVHQQRRRTSTAQPRNLPGCDVQPGPCLCANGLVDRAVTLLCCFGGHADQLPDAVPRTTGRPGVGYSGPMRSSTKSPVSDMRPTARFSQHSVAGIQSAPLWSSAWE